MEAWIKILKKIPGNRIFVQFYTSIAADSAACELGPPHYYLFSFQHASFMYQSRFANDIGAK
jgi:hypothetical protein